MPRKLKFAKSEIKIGQEEYVWANAKLEESFVCPACGIRVRPPKYMLEKQYSDIWNSKLNSAKKAGLRVPKMTCLCRKCCEISIQNTESEIYAISLNSPYVALSMKALDPNNSEWHKACESSYTKECERAKLKSKDLEEKLKNLIYHFSQLPK